MNNGELPVYPNSSQRDKARIEGGLSKREYFAAMAMQGILASGNAAAGDTKFICANSERIADELLKQLDK